MGDSHTLDLLKELGYAKQSITQAEHIYLLSERGYSKLIKIMDTDLAWEVHERLVDEYFSPGEKLAMMEDFKEEVRIENEKKKLEGNKLGADVTNGKALPLQLECDRKDIDRKTWNDNQIAKKAGVGTGTVARYKKVINSGMK